MTPEEAVVDIIEDMVDSWSGEESIIEKSDSLESIGFDSLDMINLEFYIREEFQNDKIMINLTPQDTIQAVINTVLLHLPH